MKRKEIDVLLLAALEDEYDQVKTIRPDAPHTRNRSSHHATNTGWQEISDSKSEPLLYGTFNREDGKPLRVVVAHCSSMGLVAAIVRAFELSFEYKYSCLAMCGVCAAKKKFAPGTVMVAQGAWRYGPGKSIYGDDQEYREEKVEYASYFPKSLVTLAKKYSSEFSEKFELDLRRKYPVGEGADPYSFSVKSAIFCTVPDVTIDKEIFSKSTSRNQTLEQSRRRVASVRRDTEALEMESISVPLVAESLGLKGCFFAKGVQDHAQPALNQDDKNDVYREFAAYASALFTIEFLREHFYLLEDSLPQAKPKVMDAPIPSNNGWTWNPKRTEFHNTSRHERLVVKDKKGNSSATEWFKKIYRRPCRAFLVTRTYVDKEEKIDFVFDEAYNIFIPSPIQKDEETVLLRRHIETGKVLNLPDNKGELYESCLKIIKFPRR